MKIVLLTHSEDRHFYFANKIIESLQSVVGVITGGKYLPPPAPMPIYRRMFRPNSIAHIRNRILNKVFERSLQRLADEKKVTEQAFFKEERDRFYRNHKDLHLSAAGPEHGTINSQFFVDLVGKIKPDALVVMGTTLIRKELLACAPITLNIHTGLSPYYRGGYTNLWPFIFGDLGYFGVTIHKMSIGIDSGDIIYTARPVIESSDTFSTINCKCIVLGTELMIDALRLLETGKLVAVPQWTKGKLFFNRDFNGFVAYRYFRKRKALIDNYCSLQDRGFPEIKLVGPNDTIDSSMA